MSVLWPPATRAKPSTESSDTRRTAEPKRMAEVQTFHLPLARLIPDSQYLLLYYPGVLATVSEAWCSLSSVALS